MSMETKWKWKTNKQKNPQQPQKKKKKQPTKQKTMRKPNVLRLNVFMRHKYTQKKSPNI